MNDSILESRVQHLERQLKHQRWIIAGVLLAALAVGGIAASSSDVSTEVKTKRLVVVDDKGEQMILMTSEKDGGVAAFFGAEGKVPVLIAAGRPTGGELLIKANGGQNRVEIMAEKDAGRVSVSTGGSMRQLGESK